MGKYISSLLLKSSNSNTANLQDTSTTQNESSAIYHRLKAEQLMMKINS